MYLSNTCIYSTYEIINPKIFYIILIIQIKYLLGLLLSNFELEILMCEDKLLIKQYIYNL